MNDFIQERKSLVIMIVAILFLLLGLLYLHMVKPLKDDANLAKSNVEQLESDIQFLEAQLDKNQTGQTETADNQYVLERKMPLDRSLDELILSLQEIEFVSESRIENISFNNYDGGLTEADQVIEEENETIDEEETAEGIDTEDELVETPVSDVAETLPANVKLITVNLNVVSPNFEQFELFLQEIEQLERITRVDTLSFSQPGEAELLSSEEDVDDSTISTNVQITTFYYDDSGLNAEE